MDLVQQRGLPPFPQGGGKDVKITRAAFHEQGPKFQRQPLPAAGAGALWLLAGT